MRPTKTQYFLAMAHLASQRSTCLRAQHGAVIVKEGHIIATGYNGSIAGAQHCTDIGQCERQRLGVEPGTRYETCVSVHGEANALLQAARHGASVAGATMYVTGQPCLMCARAIVNAGIARVVYQLTDRYAENGVVRLLTDAGVEVTGEE